MVKFNLISRKRAEEAVPFIDCSGRTFGIDEREDLIRYVIFGAEIQLHRDQSLDGQLIHSNQELE